MSKGEVVHIKNMVCQRCIDTVAEIFESQGIRVSNIQLGEATLTDAMGAEQIQRLGEQLSQRGFELLEDGKSALIAKIKSFIIRRIHHTNEPLTIKLSALLADELHHDYNYLSRLFSSVEGVTIERYAMLQKIEKVKELLLYNELTLSEIAYRLGYSSTAHLSSQFKKETGMNATAFRKLKTPGRKPLDSL